MPDSSQPGGAGPHRIGAVAELTGLTTHTVRVWERRYSAVHPLRTDGGTRLYSDAQVARLLLLKRLTDVGHRIGVLASLSEQQLRQLLPSDSSSARTAEPVDAPALRTAFFEALERFEPSDLDDVLSRATRHLSPRDVVLRFAGPLAQDIGERWERGEISIAQEHAGCARLRELLTRMLASAPSAGKRRFVAGTLPSERHEIGLLMATVLATLEDWQAVYLGVDLPLEELTAAVAQSRSSFLLLSLVHGEELELQTLLRELRGKLAPGVWLVVGGRAAPDLELDGVTKPTDFDDFSTWLRAVSQQDDALT